MITATTASIHRQYLSRRAMTASGGAATACYDLSLRAQSTRRKELRKTGRGKQVPPEEPKPPRETHKLLQVLGGTTKRKKLLSPKGMDVRPMMEVVKGCAYCQVHFVEMDPWVVHTVYSMDLPADLEQMVLSLCVGYVAALFIGTFLGMLSDLITVTIATTAATTDTLVNLNHTAKAAVTGGGCAYCQVHFVEMDPWVVRTVYSMDLPADLEQMVLSLCVGYVAALFIGTFLGMLSDLISFTMFGVFHEYFANYESYGLDLLAS
ncbi:hypothetical protein TEA_003408 [Camellia sinensis var. sinensis]|uniref:Uncharacterized protein n=1 Tax=Camellia sinensis var. sinensis TaxID=542762 RepID=A0A4S4DKW0_CAMSN|nr:hypothetical protein TEA_003408 [Camellia sinensis var. sinensis]